MAYYAAQIRNGGAARESVSDVTLQFVQSNIATIAAQCGKPTGLKAHRLKAENEIKAKLVICMTERRVEPHLVRRALSSKDFSRSLDEDSENRIQPTFEQCLGKRKFEEETSPTGPHRCF